MLVDVVSFFSQVTQAKEVFHVRIDIRVNLRSSERFQRTDYTGFGESGSSDSAMIDVRYSYHVTYSRTQREHPRRLGVNRQNEPEEKGKMNWSKFQAY